MPEELKKRLDADTRKRLEKIQEGYERWTHKTIWILRVLVLATLVLGVISIMLIASNGNRVEDVEATQRGIQQSRIDNTYTNCDEQNARHDKTLAALDAAIARAEKDRSLSAKRLARIKQSRATTVGLIDALAPHQDCGALIHDRFGKHAMPTALKTQ